MAQAYAELVQRPLRDFRLTFPAVGILDPSRAVENVAFRLSRIPHQPRARVAVLHRQGAIHQSVIAYLGVLRAGLTPALLRPSTSISVAEYLSHHSFVATIDSGSGDVDVHSAANSADSLEGEDLVVFTSGTTARPKGVRYSLEGVLHNLDATQSYLRVSETDRLALPLPIYYVYGLSSLHLSLRQGSAITFLDYTQPPITWLGALLDANPTIVALLPYQARLLLRTAEFRSDRLPLLRAITVAGGALGPDATIQLLRRFPETELFLMYGQTEAGPRASFVPPATLPDSAHSIGAGIPGYTHLRVADNATGAVSQLEVTSKSLMLGYLDEEDPSPIGPDGWLATGDMAYVEDNGHFVLVGRCAPFFKPFDERVSFREVLDAARDVLPDAVFRLDSEPDPIRGERLVLTATIPAADTQPYDEEQIRRALQRRLGRTRAPAKVILRHRRDAEKLD